MRKEETTGKSRAGSGFSEETGKGEYLSREGKKPQTFCYVGGTFKYFFFFQTFNLTTQGSGAS